MSLRKALPNPHHEDFEVTTDGLRWLNLVHQRLVDIRKEDLTWNPAAIAANTTAEQTVTLSGLKTDDIILAVIKPTVTAGVGIIQSRVSAADTLAVTWINTTAGSLNPAEEVYTVVYIKNSKV